MDIASIISQHIKLFQKSSQSSQITTNIASYSNQAQPSSLKVEALSRPQSPIFQLCANPMPINPSDYANAYSINNPQGSYLTLENFWALIDPIPSFSAYYWISPSSTDRTYGTIVNNANVDPSYAISAQVVSQAKKEYSISSLISMDGLNTAWHPCYAQPSDWYNANAGFDETSINFSDPDSIQESGLITIGSSPSQSLQFQMGASHASTAGKNGAKPLLYNSTTPLQSMNFKYKIAEITRPWLNSSLFSLPGITLQGIAQGYYSSGSIESNLGVFSLLPTSFVLAQDMQVSANWSLSDRQFLEQAETGTNTISLGPIPLSQKATPTTPGFKASIEGNIVSSNSMHILGWISYLVPMFPT